MSRKVAYGGILLGLNIILLLLVNVLPINTLFLLGLASLPLSIIIMEWGPKVGVIFYFGSVILSFIVMANKSQWILYVFTFGIYGLIKYLIEKDRSIVVEYALKIIVANVLVVVVYAILRFFIYIPVNFITIGIFEVAFIIYDYTYSLFIDYYNDRLRKITKMN
ncbi:MAG: hypothetical protein RRZ84_05510 [Romboutsia sp.]